MATWTFWKRARSPISESVVLSRADLLSRVEVHESNGGTVQAREPSQGWEDS